MKQVVMNQVVMNQVMQNYYFDGTLTGLLCCVFRAFQFKEFNVKVYPQVMQQHDLFDSVIDVASHEQYAQRVWNALKLKLSANALRQFYFAFLSESVDAYQHIFNYSIYIFHHQHKVEKNYTHPSVLAISQWTKQVGREKHRMEAFIRFKKTADGLFMSLINPDFNVLPLIQGHFKRRYQDQRWLIYDEKRNWGMYYDLHEIHEVTLNAQQLDINIDNGHSQSFTIDLDEQEVLYDQLWKDYFKSINIKERQNIKLHVQWVPKRYWRYLNEKLL